MTVMSPGRRTVSPRPGLRASATRPPGVTPTARRGGHGGEQIGPEVRLLEVDVERDRRAGRIDAHRIGRLLDEANVSVVAEGDRGAHRSAGEDQSRDSPDGTTAVFPAASPAISSALAAATFSIVPSSSRWTGPMLTITPTSGSAIAASSAI